MARQLPPYRPPAPFLLPVRCDPSGRAGPTPGAARGPGWVRTAHGRYLPSPLPSTVDRSSPEQRIAEAAVRLPAGGAVTGWAGLRLQGVALLDGRADNGRLLPVPLTVPLRCHPKPDTAIRWVRRNVDTFVDVRGVRCLPVRECLFDEMRLAENMRDAVVALDMTVAARLTSVERMTAFVERRRTWSGVPGVPRVRAALSLGDEDSASPPETQLRLVWQLDAGYPRPLVNRPVFDLGGRLLGYPDLLDVEACLAVEYDGEDHRRARRHSDDVDREARLREAGLEVTRATGHDLRRTTALVARLRAARTRAPFTDPGQRHWTTNPPPWFDPPLPVDVLLDLRGIDL